MGERAEKARSLFMEGYNCSQSVLGAFADLYGLDMNTAMRLSDGLGGGMGRMRLTCGAVSAMAIVAGLELSSGRPKDSDNRTEVYAKVREMSEKFAEKNGSVICAELLRSAVPKDNSSRRGKNCRILQKTSVCGMCVRLCRNNRKSAAFRQNRGISSDAIFVLTILRKSHIIELRQYRTELVRKMQADFVQSRQVSFVRCCLILKRRSDQSSCIVCLTESVGEV